MLDGRSPGEEDATDRAGEGPITVIEASSAAFVSTGRASVTFHRLVGVCVVALAFAFCLSAAARAEDKKDEKKGAKELIIGKWEHTKKEGDLEAKITMEFAKDGKLTIGIAAGDLAFSFKGKYKWADKENLEITIEDPKSKEEKTEKVKVLKISEKELEIEGKMGDKKEVTKFTKAK